MIYFFDEFWTSFFAGFFTAVLIFKVIDMTIRAKIRKINIAVTLLYFDLFPNFPHLLYLNNIKMQPDSQVTD